MKVMRAPAAGGSSRCGATRLGCSKVLIALRSAPVNVSQARTRVGVASRQKAGAVRVVPGDPANSYLIQKIEGRSDISGVRMPIRGPYLTDGQVAIIKRWIELGARRG